MKKRWVLGMIAALALSTSVAAASPVEMNEGQLNINLGVMLTPNTDFELKSLNRTYGFDGDTSFYGGVTYGITDRWGVQYDYSHYGATRQTRNYYDSNVDANEFNVLYKLNDNVNILAGYLYVGGTIDSNLGNGSGHTDGYQVGLTGWYPLADKIKTFAKVALGNNSRVYEIGFSYQIADNWDVDLSYRDVEYKDIHDIFDAKYDGVRLGVSTSF